MSQRVWVWLPQPWRAAEGLRKVSTSKFKTSTEREETKGTGHSFALLSGGRSPRLWRSCGWTSPPPLSLVVLSPQLWVTGPGERGEGWGGVIPIWYSQLSVVWDGSEGGHVSLRISDMTTLPAMTLRPLGIAWFYLPDRNGTKKALLFVVISISVANRFQWRW